MSSEATISIEEQLFQPKIDIPVEFVNEETRLLPIPVEEEFPVLPQSSLQQTIVNSLNLLMGIGLLSLPFSFSKLGWILGICLLFLFCCVACFTAHIIGDLLKHQAHQGPKSLLDIADEAFGFYGQVFVGAMFTVELFAAGLAMLILFADSLVALVPMWVPYKVQLMVGAFVLLTPVTWQKSLCKLSWLSFVGVVSLLLLVIAVFWNGVSLNETPGSILHPAVTQLWPNGWKEFGLGVGLLFVGLDGTF
jgi:vesicular inhibitory amino acid transporter